MRKSNILIITAMVMGLSLLLYFIVPRIHSEMAAHEAQRLVEHFNTVVCEAYRRCDITIIDSVVRMNTAEGKHLTGLIGVRQDMGITLDAQLLCMQIMDVKEVQGHLFVQTQEQWKYRDRKIGSGEQVGEDSVDLYDLLYTFEKMNGRWMVVETHFITPPQIGRKSTPWIMDSTTGHRMNTLS